MADTCWKEIPRHYPQVVLHRHIIMPNHIHGIIELTDISVKAEDIPPVRISDFDINNRAENIPPQPIIGSIIKGFKIGVTKWFRDNTNIQSVWQRSYHDHIIRSEHAYWRISEYIENNPIQWKKDTFHKS